MPGLPSSSVLEFYNDASVFITGGTGFLGKVTIEKLLRVCPNIAQIYVLIRVKKGKDPQMRLKETLEDPIFKPLRKENPDFGKKITCIPGDVNGLRLNMSDKDYEFLRNEVTHVIHSAATVRFNEHIKSAIGINVLGTREVVSFCNKCVRLKVFVHVSTAYSNCANSYITEDYYEPPLSGDKAISLVETLSEDRLHFLTPELIKPWPNTYTFTKAIAENIVKEQAKSIPTVIFRPAIVMGTMKEPVEGYIDNIYGPTGVIVGVGVGLMRVLYADKDSRANVVPVDLTVNAMLSCAWEAGSNFNNNAAVENSLTESNDSCKKKEIIPKIYNFVGDKNNRITWGQFLDKTHVIGIDLPSEKAIWYYTLTLTNVKLIYFSLIFFFHYIPGFLLDAVLLLLGKKPQMLKAYQKIHVFSEATGVFSSQSWEFSDGNTRKLWSRLSQRDRELFYFDMTTMNWDSYLATVIRGIRNFLFKETDSQLPAARRRMFFFWLGHRLLQLIFLALCFWILTKFLFLFYDLRANFKNPILMSTGNSTT